MADLKSIGVQETEVGSGRFRKATITPQFLADDSIGWVKV
jgi:hypothetical protein